MTSITNIENRKCGVQVCMCPQILRRNKQGISKNPLKSADFRGFLVRVTRFERAISTSQMWRGTSSATPGYSVFAIIPCCGQKSKIFLSVVIPVVRAAFWPGCVPWGNPANARAARLSGLPLLRSWMVLGILPKQVRYQLRYTRIFSIKLGVQHTANQRRRTNIV